MQLLTGNHSIRSLDLLRGLAILLVVPFSHFLPIEHSIAFGLGILGVTLFFFLSGFLMGQTFAADSRIGAYVTRRVFRILPMYWISIALIFFTEKTWTLADVVTNATFTAPLLGHSRMSGIYWTLYIEVLFYSLVPLIFLFSNRSVAALTPYLVIGAYAAALAWHLHPGPAAFFLVYCFLGLQFSQWARGLVHESTLIATIATVVAASSILPVLSPWLGLAPLICASLLFCSIRYPLHQRILEFFGYVSYSWYLLHPIIGSPVMEFLNGWNPWLVAAAADVASLAAATVTFALVERPIIAAGKRLIRTADIFASDRTMEPATRPGWRL